MNRAPLFAALFIALALAASPAYASWYDDYEAGLTAVRAGNWNVVVQKMSAAIKGNPNEHNRARTYGNVFINYHPYYYRGVAYLNLGRYEDAVRDFEKTSGAGPENLGSLDILMQRAKKSLADASAPAPEPARPAAPAVTQPAVTAPAVPQIDAALRQRATTALAAAKEKIQSAQQRRATNSQQYTQAMSMFSDATARIAAARSNDDLNAIVTMAQTAGDLADLAMPPAAPAPAPVQPAPVVASIPVTPKPAAATSTVMADHTNEVRHALESYFNGEFEDATRLFDDLARKMPNNAWIWAFLGASQYSQYAFEADDQYRTAALKSFERAKQLRNWNGGLPSKYFSKRIRRAFESPAG